jgi:ferrous iron transport protein A
MPDMPNSKDASYEAAPRQAEAGSLNDLSPGEAAVVSGIDGGAHFRSRLASLGFTPGVTVKMIQNYGRGALIVSLRGTRVALGRGEARKVCISRRPTPPLPPPLPGEGKGER